MKITEIHIGQLTIPLMRPFITAVRRTECVDDVVVMIKTDLGLIGYGSAASTPAITGETTQSIIKAIKTMLAPQLIGRPINEFNQLLYNNHHVLLKNNSAKAAIDIALHDLFAQHCGLPLYQLLGGNNNCLNSCITVSLKSHDEMVEDALCYVERGFNCLKIKLGHKSSEDIQRVEAIRKAVGREIKLLIDANQGWSYKETIDMLQAFQTHQLDITLLEQPVAAEDRVNLKAISDKNQQTIIADESCFTPQDALDLACMKACDGVNIKLMKCGGLGPAQSVYHIAQTAKMYTMVGCMLESPIGVAAIASFAASKPDIFFADLDPIFLIQENYVMGGAQAVDNEVVLSDSPGLGIKGLSQGFTLLERII